MTGCSTLAIDLANEDFETHETDQCSYGILNNDTHIQVTEYKIAFTMGSSPVISCGCEATVYFVLCNEGGSPADDKRHLCSRIYSIDGQMPDKGQTYSYTVSVEEYEDDADYGDFNTIADVYRMFVWTSEDEMWCLGDIYIDGETADGEEVTGVNADSTPALQMNTGIDDETYCTGVRVTFATNDWYEFSDGAEASGSNGQDTCRWAEQLAEEGAISVSKLSSDSNDFIDWMNEGFNWIYICVGLIGVVICCICCCAIAQKWRTKNQVIEVNNTGTNWHGGRTY